MALLRMGAMNTNLRVIPTLKLWEVIAASLRDKTVLAVDRLYL